MYTDLNVRDVLFGNLGQGSVVEGAVLTDKIYKDEFFLTDLNITQNKIVMLKTDYWRICFTDNKEELLIVDAWELNDYEWVYLCVFIINEEMV